MSSENGRALIIIGGREDKADGMAILREVARRVGRGKLVVCTAATKEPAAVFEGYARAFRNLGIKQVTHLNINSREDSRKEMSCRILEGASGVFFTGDDQISITSQMGDTPCIRLFQQIYEKGGVIAGTSSGAPVMGRTMMVGGTGDESHQFGSSFRIAPGLGLITGLIIDRHFSARGRIGRLVSAIARNPANIGIGIDEDTAILVEKGESFTVIGSGTVCVFDGTGVTNVSTGTGEIGDSISISDVRLHVLREGDGFNISERRPILFSNNEADIELTNASPDVPQSGRARVKGHRNENQWDSRHLRSKHI
jgi:cyanophycinase